MTQVEAQTEKERKIRGFRLNRRVYDQLKKYHALRDKLTLTNVIEDLERHPELDGIVDLIKEAAPVRTNFQGISVAHVEPLHLLWDNNVLAPNSDQIGVLVSVNEKIWESLSLIHLPFFPSLYKWIDIYPFLANFGTSFIKHEISSPEGVQTHINTQAAFKGAENLRERIWNLLREDIN